MKKVNLTVAFEDEKLDALEFSLKKENVTVQERMDDALAKLYEKSVPEAVREYLDSKASPAREKPKRPPKPATQKVLTPEASKPVSMKPQLEPAKPGLLVAAPVKEVGKNG